MKKCDVCVFTELNGHVPAGIVQHCEKCHQSGYGRSELHCVSCCRWFGSETVFTAHQTDDGCRDPLDLITKDGKRRFKAVERQGKLVWVRTDAPSPSHTKKRSVACESRYVHVSERVA